MKLTSEFYRGSALTLAPLLLGKLLCRATADGIEKRRITETECYYGEADTACHASKGKTPRTAIMYEQGGVAYIYLCYGIHSLLNIVTGERDFPEAVLIRGIDGANGPGKLTRLLHIDRSLNGTDLCGDLLWLEDDGFCSNYHTAERVGIDYATEEYRTKQWRFISD